MERQRKLEIKRQKEEEERRIILEQLEELRKRNLQRRMFREDLERREFGLSQEQKMSRAFTYSYFNMMPQFFFLQPPSK